MDEPPRENSPTPLLGHAASDRQAAAELLPLVYNQLRAIAQERMKEERPGHTLQATALVHEAFLRLTAEPGVRWAGRAHFFHAAAEAMRRILIEHARSRATAKRGGDGQRPPPARLPLSVADLAAADDRDQIVSLDDAISRLERQDAELAAIVRFRFYAGLTVQQTAEALGLSPATVKRRWEYARAALFEDLHADTA